MSSPALVAPAGSPVRRPPTDPVGLSWLVTVRWTTLAAGVGAMVAGRSGLEAAAPLTMSIGWLSAAAISNVWLTWRVRAGRTASTLTAAGLLVCADVALLSWLLLRSGGVLNPASVFYLVQIVVTALVLGRTWTWVVTGLSVTGYASLFLTPTDELRAAQVMHPEIGMHMRGMWLAFALTALIIAILVTRLAIAVERRDRALEVLRDRNTRATRFAGLATLATGAAHELSTPLATIAVAAHELERSLEHRHDDRDLHRDARLIRGEIDRCRRILDDLAGRSGEPLGEAPRRVSLSDVVAAVKARLTPDEARRLQLDLPVDAAVVWPVDVVARAIGNIVRNGLQASAVSDFVRLSATIASDGQIRIETSDRGAGMSADHLTRAGEPFFTTKPASAGTGLGLFVTRSSVEQLGGTFALASTPGRGTSATIVLPRDVVSTTARPDV